MFGKIRLLSSFLLRISYQYAYSFLMLVSLICIHTTYVHYTYVLSQKIYSRFKLTI